MENLDNSNHTKLLPVISGLFVGILVVSNVLATKIVNISFLVFDGGTLLFPFSYIFADVLTEVYGYKNMRKIIWTGFVMLIFMSLNTFVIGRLPAEETWGLQQDFENILMQMPRIALASILGYFAGTYSNAVVLSVMKIKTKGKHLWMRTIGSTLVGEFLDSLVFVIVAFGGTQANSIIISMILSNYLFKTLVEIVFTPVTYKVINFTKKYEQLDHYDINEKYNPLPFAH